MATPYKPFITGPVLEYRRPEERDVSTVPSSWGEGFGAAALDGFMSSPGPLIFRWLERQSVQGGEVLQPEEAQRRFALDGLTFDKPIDANEAQMLYDTRRATLHRESVMSRSPISGTSRIIATLGGSVLDPLNIAASVIPGAVLARAGFEAAAIGAAGSIGRRAAYGAAEGAIGAAGLLPVVWAGYRAEGRPFDSADALMFVTFGTLLGAGLHAGVAAYTKWRKGGAELPPIENALQNDLTPEVRADVLRGAVANVIEGRPVNVTPVVDAALGRMLQRKIMSDILLNTEARISTREARALEALLGVEAKSTALPALRTRIAELERETTSLRTQRTEIIRDQIAPDEATTARIAAINQERVRPGTSAARKRDLDAEFRMLTEGVEQGDQAALNKLRAKVEVRGLGTAASKAEAKLGKAAAQAAAIESNIRKAQLDFRQESKLSASRRAVAQALTERMLRKFSANVGAWGDITPDIIASAAQRIMRAQKGDIDKVIDQELDNLANLVTAPGGARGEGATAPGAAPEASTSAPGGTQRIVAGDPQQALERVGQENTRPYVDPDGQAASEAAAATVASSPAPKARSPEQGIGETTPEVRELDELMASHEQALRDLEKSGEITEADKASMAEADTVVAEAEELGRARDLAAFCLGA